MSKMIQIGLKDFNLCEKEGKFKTKTGEIITKKYINFPRLGYVSISTNNYKLLEDRKNPTIANLKVYLNPKITYTFATRNYDKSADDKYLIKKMTGQDVFNFYQEELKKNDQAEKKLFISVKKVDVDSKLRPNIKSKSNELSNEEEQELDEIVEETETNIPSNSNTK